SLLNAATRQRYPLSLHDALPIYKPAVAAPPKADTPAAASSAKRGRGGERNASQRGDRNRRRNDRRPEGEVRKEREGNRNRRPAAEAAQPVADVETRVAQQAVPSPQATEVAENGTANRSGRGRRGRGRGRRTEEHIKALDESVIATDNQADVSSSDKDDTGLNVASAAAVSVM